MVPQAAQPIEFACPLCSAVHAAYIFGTAQFRVFRCGGCGLTFGQPKRNTEAPAPDRRVARDAADHTALLAAIEAAAASGPALILADKDDVLLAFLSERGVKIGRVAAPDSMSGSDWGETYQAAIVTESLMRVSDPGAALAKIRRHLAPERTTAGQRAPARRTTGAPWAATGMSGNRRTSGTSRARR